MKGLKDYLRHNGITVRIVALFLLLVIIPYIALVGGVYLYARENIISGLSKTNMDTIMAVSDSMHISMNEREEDSMSLYYTGCVDMLEQEDPLDDAEVRRIEDVLTSLCYSNSGIMAAYLESEKGSFHGGRNYPELLAAEQPHWEEIAEAGGRCLWYPTRELHGRANESCFLLTRAINGKHRKNLGTLYLVISDKFITNAFSNLSTEYSTWYVTEEDGTILYCSEKTRVGLKRDVSMLQPHTRRSFQIVNNTQRQQEILAVCTLMDVKWYCISEIELQTMYHHIRQLGVPLFLVSLIYLTFLILMLNFMRKYVLLPLRSLKSSMDQYAQDELEQTQIKIVGIGEFESLSSHFNRMTKRISSLMTAFRNEEEEKNRQRMNALSAQLTPHFIYNALNTIKWVAVLNQQEKIQKLVESLTGIFMNAARVEDGSYTLRDELMLIENYAVIQKARFFNFELIIDADADCLDCGIRKLLLQPIVENAIVHGLNRGRVKEGIVRVKAWKEDNILRMLVSDNGIGFDVEQWRRCPEDKKEHTNIGIHNVEEIIRLEYGAPYNMEIHSSIGMGTTVSYTLPALERGERHDSDNYS